MHPPQRLQHSTSWYPMLPQNFHLHMATILIILFIVELSWPHLTPHIHIVSASTTLACAVLHNSNALVSCPFCGRPDMPSLRPCTSCFGSESRKPTHASCLVTISLFQSHSTLLTRPDHYRKPLLSCYFVAARATLEDDTLGRTIRLEPNLTIRRMTVIHEAYIGWWSLLSTCDSTIPGIKLNLLIFDHKDRPKLCY